MRVCGDRSMKTRLALPAVALLLRCALALAQTTALPADFTVGDIRVEGLQRVSEGTVYNYLPVNIGDHLTPRACARRSRRCMPPASSATCSCAARATRWWSWCSSAPRSRASRSPATRTSRPRICRSRCAASDSPPARPSTARCSRTSRSTSPTSTTRAASTACTIDTKVEEESGNRVKIKIDIKEGTRAKIREINIVGNTKFKEKDILETLELKTPNWLSWYKQDDRYSRESLQGDLEKIRNYYMDRGYANFQLESTQVAIAPEKEDIFITVNIDQGAGLQGVRRSSSPAPSSCRRPSSSGCC